MDIKLVRQMIDEGIAPTETEELAAPIETEEHTPNTLDDIDYTQPGAFKETAKRIALAAVHANGGDAPIDFAKFAIKALKPEPALHESHSYRLTWVDKDKKRQVKHLSAYVDVQTQKATLKDQEATDIEIEVMHLGEDR